MRIKILSKIQASTSKNVTKKEADLKITDLKEKSAQGPDEISPQLLKIAPTAIAEGLRINLKKIITARHNHN